MRLFKDFITEIQNKDAIFTDHSKLHGHMLQKGYLSVGPVGGPTSVYHHMTTGDVVTHTHAPESISHDVWTVREHSPKHIFKDNYSSSGRGLTSLHRHLDTFHKARGH